MIDLNYRPPGPGEEDALPPKPAEPTRPGPSRLFSKGRVKALLREALNAPPTPDGEKAARAALAQVFGREYLNSKPRGWESLKRSSKLLRFALACRATAAGGEKMPVRRKK